MDDEGQTAESPPSAIRIRYDSLALHHSKYVDHFRYLAQPFLLAYYLAQSSHAQEMKAREREAKGPDPPMFTQLTVIAKRKLRTRTPMEMSRLWHKLFAMIKHTLKDERSPEHIRGKSRPAGLTPGTLETIYRTMLADMEEAEQA